VRLLRTLRLDASDTLVFPRAAAPGEWAVPGGFCFWGDAPGSLASWRRQAFRAGFLGLDSFGWSTLVEVAEAGEEAAAAAQAALAAHLLAEHGAPDAAAAAAAAAEEIAFAAGLAAEQPPGTVIAMTRTHDADGAQRERFRTLSRRAGEGIGWHNGRPIFEIVPDDAWEEEGAAPPDLPRLAPS
jgi:pyruvate/2-oxoglutarate dehydrogenase complex dihydrolipoamide acyltransferase (E2) component